MITLTTPDGFSFMVKADAITLIDPAGGLGWPKDAHSVIEVGGSRRAVREKPEVVYALIH